MDENPDSKPAGVGMILRKGKILLKPHVYLVTGYACTVYIGDVAGNVIRDSKVFEEGFKLARKRGYLSPYGYELTQLGKAMMNLTQ